MAERRQFLDRLTPDVRAHVSQIGGDPDFVDFLLGWYGLLRMDPSLPEAASLKIRTWPYWSTTRQRQEKRKLQRQYRRTWKKKWRHIQALARGYQPSKFKGGLFSIDPQGPNPAHGTFRLNFWLAVRDTKNYFRRIKKRPHWNLIADVFFPKHAFGYAQAEWARRKARFAKLDHEESLNQALSFYGKLKPVILEVLKSGIPMWASPHREHVERLRAEPGFETMIQTMTGEGQIGRTVPQQPVASEGNDPAQSTLSRKKKSPTRTRPASRRRGSRE
jgi:hypothetical protein